jgi:hypothetical protein
VIYKDLFDACINREDLSKIKQKFLVKLRQLRLNSEFTDSTFAALKKLLPILVEDPSAAVQAEITKAVRRYVITGVNLVESQDSLDNASTNVVLRRDPLNKEFYALFDAGQQFIERIADNPKAASVYFNQKNANAMARLTVVMADLVLRLN